MRPDKIGFYVTINDGIFKVSVDADRPDAWRKGLGRRLIDRMVEEGHVIVQVGNQVNFVTGRGRAPPDKIILDWVL